MKTWIPSKDETPKSHHENKPRKHDKIKIMFVLNQIPTTNNNL